MDTLLDIFMRRDGLSALEAKDKIKEMKSLVKSGEDPEEVLFDEGLEPDYIEQLY